MDKEILQKLQMIKLIEEEEDSTWLGEEDVF